MWEKIWKIFVRLIFNERGEIDLTKETEELEASEESELSGDETEDTETQDTADTDQALKDSDGKEIPADVPYARFKEVNDRAKAGDESQTKFDQFKRLGEEGYYQLYPDEKPDDHVSASKAAATDFRELPVEDGQYNGWKFGDVFERDERAAFQIDPYYAQILREEKVDGERKVESAHQKRVSESEAEINTFSASLGNELFGKSEGLDDTENAKINHTIDATIAWMKETGRGFGNIADAYLLMTVDGKLADKADRTLSGVAAALREDAPGSIASNRTTASKGGYGRFLGMTDAQVAEETEKFSDEENNEFLSKAPPEVQKKFPALPWR